MCGRFIVYYTYEELPRFLENDYEINDINLDYTPRYNVAPGQHVLSIIFDGENYRACTFKCGLVPPFSIDDKTGYKMINARSESIEEKASFKDSKLTNGEEEGAVSGFKGYSR